MRIGRGQCECPDSDSVVSQWTTNPVALALPTICFQKDNPPFPMAR